MRSAETIVEPLAHRAHRGHDALGRRHAELRDEPGRAHHAQRIVGERDLRLERRVEHLGGEVTHAPVRIDEPTVGKPHRHRVDREVAPRQVGLDVVAERDRGLAMFLGVDLAAERGDLDERAVASAPRRCRTSRRRGSGAPPTPAARGSSARGGRSSRSRGRNRSGRASCRARFRRRGTARGPPRRTEDRAPGRSAARRARRRKCSARP